MSTAKRDWGRPLAPSRNRDGPPLREAGPTGHILSPATMTLAGSVVALIFFAALAEMAARAPFVRRSLPAPHLGIGYWFLDLKLDRLQRFSEQGPVDVLFTGHSTVDAGIDPQAFNRSFHAVTGKKIRSFNLGIAKLDLPSLALLLRIVAGRSRPALVIAGFLPEDLLEDMRSGRVDTLGSTPWVRQRLDRSNLEGWLADHSAAYRYFLRFRLWLQQPKFSRSITAKDRNMAADGYRIIRNTHVISGEKKEASERPAPSRHAYRQASPRLLAALDGIMHFCARQGIEIVWVEMPLHRTDDFVSGVAGQLRRQLAARAAERIRRHGGLFIRSGFVDVQADAFWSQRNHLNSIGADRFSSSLGKEIGQAFSPGAMAGTRPDAAGW
jgi:hypothetical protein